MNVSLLNHFLISQLAAFMLVFCRTGAAMMLMPGIGDVYVNPRIRLLFALVFSALLTPILQPRMPMVPDAPIGLFLMLGSEILIGSFIGLLARAILSALHVAGTIIAQQSSLAAASIFDPSSGAQSPVVSNLLTVAATTLFFVMGLHYLVLAALVQSYDLFPAGVFPDVGDMNLLHLRVVADAFNLGVLLSAPYLVFSLLFYLAGGLLTRLMPNFQIFFVMMAPQMLIAFFLLLALMPVILNTYTNFLQEQFMNFIKTS